MDPEQTLPPASGEPIPQAPAAPQVAQPSQTERISSMASDPRISKYLGKATKVVVACAVSGSILLVVAILAVVNLLNQVTSAIHP